MRSIRIAATVAALLTASLALSACGSDEDARARVEDSARDVRAAITEFFPQMSKALEARDDQPIGDGRYEACGTPFPDSVSYSVEAALQQADVTGREQGDRIVETAESTGWTVTVRSGSSIRAERGDLELTIQFGGAVSVQLRSPCIDAPGDLITSLSERPLEPIDLS